MTKIDDVAKLANVSKGTVSNVFSQKRPISKQVKERVLNAAKELNYTPNHIARSLVTKKTMTIGLNIPYTKNLFLSNFHTNLINGVITEASLLNYRILIDTLSQEDIELPYISSIPMDGVVILDPKIEDPRIDLLSQLGVPFVVIGKPFNSRLKRKIAYVDNNNEEMAYEVTQLLINKGHERILYLNAPTTMTVSHERKRGFLKALSDNKIDSIKSTNYYKDNTKEDPSKYGYDITKRFFSDVTCQFTAIIADTDKVALGALSALKSLNKSVPKDVSLIALSDDLVLSHQTEPPLTTVDLRSSRLGSEAVKLLFNQMDLIDDSISQRTIVDAQINQRGSCVNIQT